MSRYPYFLLVAFMALEQMVIYELQVLDPHRKVILGLGDSQR